MGISRDEFKKAIAEINTYEPYLFDSCDLAEVILHLSDKPLSNLALQKMLFLYRWHIKKILIEI